MWLIYAIGSAFFAGVTSILAKCGIKKTDSTVATAVRTIVVLIFSWGIVFLTGAGKSISQLEPKAVLFLVLSGMATGASWLCYFRALQLGNINKVVAIDKSSTVLTILLALIFLKEGISIPKLIALLLITAGIYLMIGKKKEQGQAQNGKSWFFYAVGSAVFASLTAILGKIGVSGINSNLGTAVRTGVVLVMAWLMVFVTGKQKEIREISKRELLFICSSGIATGLSWLCYYRALSDGPASVVAPVDKLSILVTAAFSRIVFGERLEGKEKWGLLLLTVGTVFMALV